MNYVGIMKAFVYAERLSDWTIHLYAVSKMLNLLAATGDKNYAKCGRLYLQQWNVYTLQQTHLYVH